MAVKQAAEWSDKVEQILKLFPVHIRKVMEQAEVFQRLSQKLEEIRVRVNQPLELVTADGAYFLNNGALVRQTDRQCLSVSEEDLRQMSTLMSRYSLYAYEEEIRQGFLTVEGGHRIGVCGQVMQLNGRINRIYPILYLNIRIARERKACGALLYKQLWREQEPENTLLLSAPGNGKTTLLRDLIRLFSNGDEAHPGKRIGLVDERSEIGGSYQGIPQNDVGIRTDVLDCCSKAEGMVMLLRSMAPQVIAVDEIGNYEDIRAIEMTLNSGCKLLATVHGSSIDEIRKKPLLERLIKEHVFERYIILQKETAGKIGKVREIYDERGTCLYQRQRSVC